MPLLSRLQFGSFLVYSPRGESTASRYTQTFTYALKGDKPLQDGIRATRAVAEALVVRLNTGEPSPMMGLRELLTDDAILVPVPRSGKTGEGFLWPAELLATEMVRAGIGAEVRLLLQRRVGVPASRSSSAPRRPMRHLETMALAPSELWGARPESRTPFVLVDDVVTSGATLLGAASRLQEGYPSSEVLGFAAVRTISEGEVERLLEPVVGWITVQPGGRSRRDP